MNDLKYYMNLSYKIVMDFIEDEGESYYKLTIPRLPGVIAFGATVEEAMTDLKGAKEIWVKKCLQDGIRIPQPIDETYSGRVTLRMPKSLHKELAQTAADEDIILNQYIVTVLEQGNLMNTYEKVTTSKFVRFISLLTTPLNWETGAGYHVRIDSKFNNEGSTSNNSFPITSQKTTVRGLKFES
ncbi:MAG: type II toxin-antitoxin system HicB family antitoxin [Lentilactobacillus diolivorans]